MTKRKRENNANLKQRKKLEYDYGLYSINSLAYTLQDKHDSESAKSLHDRAITSIDLANIYFKNGNYDTALIYVKQAIEDLKSSRSIYIKLNSKPEEIQKCTDSLSIFRQNVRTIRQRQANPPSSSLNAGEITNSPPHDSILISSNSTTVKSGASSSEMSSLSGDESTNDEMVCSLDF